jgi:hypothetical protein
LLEAEIKRSGRDRENKEDLSKFMNEYIDNKKNTLMTDKGDALMSAYSYKGFEILKSHMKESPITNESFLKEYIGFLKKYII